MTIKNVQAISLFTGAGGLDIASTKCGIDISVAIENDSDCVNTLLMNSEFKNTKIVNQDIKKIKPIKIEKYLNKKKPSLLEVLHANLFLKMVIG